MTETKMYRYSEIFGPTPQGEGLHSGKATVWLRLFACNLTCSGFGQKDPTDPRTYELPYEDIDLTNIVKLEDLPVFDKGCDSSYSWSAKYKHLAHQATALEIINRLKAKLTTPINPAGMFTHPVSKNEFHLAFTGGEPLASQKALVDIISQLLTTPNDMPMHITVETNGTKSLSADLKNVIISYLSQGGTWTWSVSPKLFQVSGEKNSRAIVPSAVASYTQFPDALMSKIQTYLKFVINNKDAAWEELSTVIDQFNAAGRNTTYTAPIWIMPVGATAEQQKDDETRIICERALDAGYYISARIHCYIWGNTIGV